VGEILELVHQGSKENGRRCHPFNHLQGGAEGRPLRGVAGRTSGDAKWGDPYPESTTGKRARRCLFFPSPRAKRYRPLGQRIGWAPFTPRTPPAAPCPGPEHPAMFQ